MSEEVTNTEEALRKLNTVIEQLEEILGSAEVLANPAARVCFEEALEQMKKAREQFGKSPQVQ